MKTTLLHAGTKGVTAKMKKRLLSLILACLMLALCACESDGTPTVSSASGQDLLREMWRSAFWFSVSPIQEASGEDYVIQWEDAGMEAHIRFLLDRPEGDILHSDVWNIQVLAIRPANGNPHDVLLEAPAEGSDDFTYESIAMNKNVKQYYKALQDFPALESLSDLRHFDSLQVLDLDLLATAAPLTDLRGLEECQHLKVLRVTNARPETLEPVAEMTELEQLMLNVCGTLDLTPLKSMPCLSGFPFTDPAFFRWSLCPLWSI